MIQLIGNGDSNPGNGDVNNPLEEDTTGGGNINFVTMSCLKASALIHM